MLASLILISSFLASLWIWSIILGPDSSRLLTQLAARRSITSCMRNLTLELVFFSVMISLILSK